MKKLIFLLLSILFVIHPVSAAEITAPEIPTCVQQRMPETTDAFDTGFMQLLEKALEGIRPDLSKGISSCALVAIAVLVVSLIQSISNNQKPIWNLAGAAAIGTVLLHSTNAMIGLGAQTICQISDYGTLLLPVMTSAMAAQGRLAGSSALYAGTAFFNYILSSVISGWLVPAVYLFLALSLANSAAGEDMLRRMADFIKGTTGWILKTILVVFTTYISITGVVSGTADAAALKTAKITISSVVPVVGGILSDASEAVLVSAGLIKNAAGIYGILAILAIFLEPFLRIGCHYLTLKLTSGICSIFAPKRMSDLIADFSASMGLLLAMTGASCVLCLISTFCFMKGVG